MKTRQIRILALLVVSFLVTQASKAAPCPASATVRCLSGQRFSVSVQWKDFQGNTGQGQGIGLTPDTGYFWFFTDNNIELVVKVLDARAFNNKFWVFFGALSNVEYALKVTDTVTGARKEYQNPSGQFASVGDTAAFPAAGTGIASAHETVTVEGTMTPSASLEPIQRFLAAAEAKSASGASEKERTAFTPCLGPSTSLYLAGCRFHLEAQWTDPQGATGPGQAVQLTNDTGYFWFFTDNNVELIVKVLDARAFNGDFWVFFGALSNVRYQITVTDTLSGDVKVYKNPQGTFASVGDTTAFQPGPSVTIATDNALSSSGRFDRTGGALTATGADGTKFILTVPQDALILPVRITMTPVSRVDGLPNGGTLLAAVQIQPDGLFLWERGDLKIVPPVVPNLKRLAYFRYRGPGESFTPYPGVPKATVIEMPVSYLAGYGASVGAPPGSTLQFERVRRIESGSPLAPYLALAADLFRRQQNDEFATNEDYLSEVFKVWADAWNEVVRPALQGLGGDCDLDRLRSAFQMAWELREYDPESDPSWASYSDQIFSIMKQKVLECINLAYQRCKTNREPREVMLILKLEALLERVGLISDAEHNDVQDKVNRCLRFEIDFESALTSQLGGESPLTERLKVRAIVPIRLEAIDQNYILSGTAEIRHEFVSIFGPVCSYSAETSPGLFSVDRMDVGIFDTDSSVVDRADVSVDMVYSPGDPEEKVTVTCPITGPVTGSFAPVFAPLYAQLHWDALLPGGAGQ